MERQDLEILRRVPLFAGLDEPQLGALLREVSVRDHPKGQLLFQQGDPAAHFYVVLNGRVKLFRLTTDGDRALVEEMTHLQEYGGEGAMCERMAGH